MAGDQGSTGPTIDVYTQRGGCIVHKQVERRGDKIFMRLSKRSVTGLLGSESF